MSKVRRVRALATVAIACLATQVALAQAPLSFEVASVRLNTAMPPLTSGTQIRSEQFESIAIPLISIITRAYGVTRIEGAPEWVRSERYDIRAKAPKPSSQQEMLQMLQTLLAERFKLKAHSETRVVDIYGLVFARPDQTMGPGIRPVKVDCETNQIVEGPDPGLIRSPRPPCGTTRVRTTMVSGPVLLEHQYPGVTMARLAQTL